MDNIIKHNIKITYKGLYETNYGPAQEYALEIHNKEVVTFVMHSISGKDLLSQALSTFNDGIEYGYLNKNITYEEKTILFDELNKINGYGIRHDHYQFQRYF